MRAIAEAAEQGDSVALAVISEVGHYLGIAVANLLNVLNPKTIVLGGAISQAGSVFLNVIDEAVKARTVWDQISNTPVVISELGERAMAVGAATQVLDLALQDYRFFDAGPSLLTASEA